MRARDLVLGALLSACGSDRSPGELPPTDPADVERTVRDLAALGEKRVATPGGAAAVTYMRARLAAAGLDEVNVERFHVPRHEVRAASMTVTVDGAPRTLGFEVLEGSGAGKVDAEIVFAGGAEPGDLAGLALDGKIALVERRTAFHRSSQYRAVEARGALAMLYVSDAPDNLRQVGTVRLSFETTGSIPALSIGADDGAALHRGARAAIDVDAGFVDGEGANVLGVLHGREPGHIVVGAHFDTWFTGSCDNGGGAAALVALAERRARGEPPRHDLVFAAYDGEEVSLYGGYHYLAHHREGLLAALNFEIPSAKDATVSGLGHSGHAALADALAAAGLRGVYSFFVDLDVLPRISGGVIPTDIQGLYRDGVATASTASTFAYYHTAQDTPDKVDFELLASSVDAFEQVLDALDAAPAAALTARDPALWNLAVELIGDRVNVTVTDSSGAPQGNAFVEAELLHDDFLFDAALDATTATDGRASLTLPAGGPGRRMLLRAGDLYPRVERFVALP